MGTGFELCCLGRRLHAVASSLDRSGMECCARERLLVMLSKHGHGTKPLKTVGLDVLQEDPTRC
jgi:hypothetical protein